jgi:hypothetical protein
MMQGSSVHLYCGGIADQASTGSSIHDSTANDWGLGTRIEADARMADLQDVGCDVVDGVGNRPIT